MEVTRNSTALSSTVGAQYLMVAGGVSIGAGLHLAPSSRQPGGQHGQHGTVRKREDRYFRKSGALVFRDPFIGLDHTAQRLASGQLARGPGTTDSGVTPKIPGHRDLRTS